MSPGRRVWLTAPVRSPVFPQLPPISRFDSSALSPSVTAIPLRPAEHVEDYVKVIACALCRPQQLRNVPELQSWFGPVASSSGFL
jgi:hypothetical protein